jgi:uncharacterized protein (TIGR02996 family)
MEQAFLQAILERPSADDSWLVLADWLEENGNGPRAELVRLQITLRREARPRARTAGEKRVQQLLSADVRPVVASFVNSIGVQMALVPPGEFYMGSPSQRGRAVDDANEFPRRLVRISRPFYLGARQVTQGQYRAVMDGNPSYFSSFGPGREAVAGLENDHLPVENVSYVDVDEFCRRLSESPVEKKAGRVYRLPTEAEWEYACRGCICQSAYSFGSRLLPRHARFGDPDGSPRPVGVGRANLFGLRDMHGNVWEWCSDWYAGDYYQWGPTQDPPGPDEGAERVLRGGGWCSKSRLCRSAVRGHNALTARLNYNGFRLALTASQQGQPAKGR